MRSTLKIAGAAAGVLVVVAGGLVAERFADGGSIAATSADDHAVDVRSQPPPTRAAVPTSQAAAGIATETEPPLDWDVAEVTSDLMARCGLSFDDARSAHRAMDLGMDVWQAISEPTIATFGGWELGACGGQHVFVATDHATADLIHRTADELGASVRVALGEHTFDQLERWRLDVWFGRHPQLGEGAVAALAVEQNRVVVWPTVDVDPADLPTWAVLGNEADRPFAGDAVPEPAGVATADLAHDAAAASTWGR